MLKFVQIVIIVGLVCLAGNTATLKSQTGFADPTSDRIASLERELRDQSLRLTAIESALEKLPWRQSDVLQQEPQRGKTIKRLANGSLVECDETGCRVSPAFTYQGVPVYGQSAPQSFTSGCSDCGGGVSGYSAPVGRFNRGGPVRRFFRGR